MKWINTIRCSNGFAVHRMDEATTHSSADVGATFANLWWTIIHSVNILAYFSLFIIYTNRTLIYLYFLLRLVRFDCVCFTPCFFFIVFLFVFWYDE